MDAYAYESTLGEGAYSYVWLCRERETGRLVAIKGFKAAHEDAEIMRLAMREVGVLKSIKHNNIVNLHEAYKSKSGRVYLIFEYVEHTLYTELDRMPGGLPSSRAKVLLWQLLHALTYLHGRKVVHRDIKPSNILLSDDGQLKLCDFGFARYVSCPVKGAQRLSSYVVTRWYRAPEVLVSDNYGPAADIWAVGCTFAELLTGRPLFPGRSTVDQLWLTMRCLGPLAPAQASRMRRDSRLSGLVQPHIHKTLRQRLPHVDPAMFQVIQACLEVDPCRRPSAAELLQFPCFWEVPRLVGGTPLEAKLSAGVKDKPAPSALTPTSATHASTLDAAPTAPAACPSTATPTTSTSVAATPASVVSAIDVVHLPQAAPAAVEGAGLLPPRPLTSDQHPEPCCSTASSSAAERTALAAVANGPSLPKLSVLQQLQEQRVVSRAGSAQLDVYLLQAKTATRSTDPRVGPGPDSGPALPGSTPTEAAGLKAALLAPTAPTTPAAMSPLIPVPAGLGAPDRPASAGQAGLGLRRSLLPPPATNERPLRGTAPPFLPDQSARPLAGTTNDAVRPSRYKRSTSSSLQDACTPKNGPSATAPGSLMAGLRNQHYLRATSSTLAATELNVSAQPYGLVRWTSTLVSGTKPALAPPLGGGGGSPPFSPPSAPISGGANGAGSVVSETLPRLANLGTPVGAPGLVNWVMSRLPHRRPRPSSGSSYYQVQPQHYESNQLAKAGSMQDSTARSSDAGGGSVHGGASHRGLTRTALGSVENLMIHEAISPVPSPSKVVTSSGRPSTVPDLVLMQGGSGLPTRGSLQVPGTTVPGVLDLALSSSSTYMHANSGSLRPSIGPSRLRGNQGELDETELVRRHSSMLGAYLVGNTGGCGSSLHGSTGGDDGPRSLHKQMAGGTKALAVQAGVMLQQNPAAATSMVHLAMVPQMQAAAAGSYVGPASLHHSRSGVFMSPRAPAIAEVAEGPDSLGPMAGTSLAAHIKKKSGFCESANGDVEAKPPQAVKQRKKKGFARLLQKGAKAIKRAFGVDESLDAAHR